jgi:hypothetical protein
MNIKLVESLAQVVQSLSQMAFRGKAENPPGANFMGESVSGMGRESPARSALFIR